MNIEFLKRKFYQLVVPFFSWYVISYIVNSTYRHDSFLHYLFQVLITPDVGLWFLWVLFLNFCWLAFIKQLFPKLKYYSYILVWLAIYAIPTGKFGIGLVKEHFPFFAAGYLIFVHRNILARYRSIALAFSVVTFPLLVLTWHRTYYPSFVMNMNLHLGAHHLSVVTAGDLATIHVYSFFLLFYRYLVPFTGIGFVYWFLQAAKNKYTNAILGFVGLYTLDIYVAHFYFLRFAIGRSWFEMISGFVFALVASLLLGMFVLRRTPLLSTIFLGGRAQPLIPSKKTK